MRDGNKREKEIMRERKKKHYERKLKTKKSRMKKTRPDTRPPVADGWAGAEMRDLPLFDSMVTDQWTDGRTDGRTDGWTDKASYRVACPQLKKPQPILDSSITNIDYDLN